MTAVSNLSGDRAAWESYPPFSQAMCGNPLEIITFREMVIGISQNLTATLAGTEVGRMLQMFKAAGITI